jgi:hypothetical protein
VNAQVFAMIGNDEFDPNAMRKEAAMFYGLFLRGHSVEQLRRDIDVPKRVLEKWLRSRRYEPGFQESLKRVYQYRKQVLAIFDELVMSEKNKARLQ